MLDLLESHVLKLLVLTIAATTANVLVQTPVNAVHRTLVHHALSSLSLRSTRLKQSEQMEMILQYI
jgi:hypothetical protein